MCSYRFGGEQGDDAADDDDNHMLIEDTCTQTHTELVRNDCTGCPNSYEAVMMMECGAAELVRFESPGFPQRKQAVCTGNWFKPTIFSFP